MTFYHSSFVRALLRNSMSIANANGRKNARPPAKTILFIGHSSIGALGSRAGERDMTLAPRPRSALSDKTRLLSLSKNSVSCYSFFCAKTKSAVSIPSFTGRSLFCSTSPSLDVVLVANGFLPTNNFASFLC